MRYISFYNVKGGTAKTHSAISFAIILSQKYKKRVLFVDIDPQSSATKSLGCYNENDEDGILSIADVMLAKEPIAEKAIKHSKYGVDVIPSSFDLLGADRTVMGDVLHPQQFHLKTQLKPLENDYDFCIFDFSPYPTITAVNALCITDDVLVPIKLGKYGTDGLENVIESVVELKDFNPKLGIRGCFSTMYSRAKLNTDGLSELKEALAPFGLPVYNTYIRNTCKVGESESTDPVVISAPKCTATEDYYELVDEYLQSIS